MHLVFGARRARTAAARAIGAGGRAGASGGAGGGSCGAHPIRKSSVCGHGRDSAAACARSARCASGAVRRNRSALLSLGEQPCAHAVTDRLGRLMYKLALHKLHKQAMVKHINGFGFAPAA